MDAKQKLAYERDNLLKSVVQLRKEITDAATHQQTTDAQRAKLETEVEQLKVSPNPFLKALVFCHVDAH